MDQKPLGFLSFELFINFSGFFDGGGDDFSAFIPGGGADFAGIVSDEVEGFEFAENFACVAANVIGNDVGGSQDAIGINYKSGPL